MTEECNFPLEACLKAGVLKSTEDGQVRDYFYDHTTLPNRRRGRIIHLSGRRLDGGVPKYLHLPGPIHYLCNEDALLKGKAVILAEGATDCISAVQAGYAAAGVLGVASFKPEYVSKLSGCETVYICFDDAGRQGAVKVAALIGERTRIVQLPEGLDLNDYLNEHGKEDFDALLASGKDLLKYEIGLIPPDIDKTELPRRLEPILKRLATLDKARAAAYLS